jgi:hypothetical protein
MPVHTRVALLDHRWHWPASRRPAEGRLVPLGEDANFDDCLACAARRGAALSWIRDFREQPRVDGRAAASARTSLDFCAAHMRQLLADGAAAPWMTSVFALLVTTANHRLQRGHPQIREGCPLCATEQRAQEAVVREVAAGRGDGKEPANVLLCTEHTVAALRRIAERVGHTAGPQSSILVTAERLRHRLQAVLKSADAADSAAVVTRADDDASRRAAWASTVEAVSRCLQNAADIGVLHRVQSLLDGQNCPLCASSAAAGHEYLSGLCDRCVASGELAEHGSLLCARHLHDFVFQTTTESAVSRIVRENALFWEARVARFVDTVLGSRVRGGQMRRLVAALASPVACAACLAERIAMQRTRDLLNAAAFDHWTRELIDASHGVCLVHGAELAPTDPLGARLRARLALAEWELTEAVRHNRPDRSYEYQGSEMQAWLQVPTLLDGGIYCGCAAPDAGSSAPNCWSSPVAASAARGAR